MRGVCARPATVLTVLAALFIGSQFLCGIAHAAARSDEGSPLLRSVVEVVVTSNPPDLIAPWQRTGPEVGRGSGVIIEGERILTAAHVVADHVLVEVRRGGVGRRYTATVEHVCHACDLALLEVADASFFRGARPLPIGELPRVQQAVRVYGFPMGGEGVSVTSGIVSRIGVDYYPHTWDRLLLVQVDAAVNPGNSGGPAVSAGRIVGIAMASLEEAENVGYIVPAPVIDHFLADVEDERLDGFPDLGVQTQTLENEALRRRLGLAPDDGGVLVAAVSRRGAALGTLRPGDVLLAVDRIPVYEDATVEIAGGLRIEWTFVFQRKQAGSTAEVRLLRDGTARTETIVLTPPAPLVTSGGYDEDPPYRIFAGLVFQPASLRYLRASDGAWSALSPYLEDPTRADYEMLVPERGAEDRREIVVLSRVLRSETTRGYEELENAVVLTVNDVPVRDLSHLSRLLDAAVGEFVTVTTERGAVISLRRGEAESRGPQILERYQILDDRSPGLPRPTDHTARLTPAGAAAPEPP